MYFDQCASNTQIKNLETSLQILQTYYANPNSKHSEGLKSQKLLQDCIHLLCENLNITKEQIIFTSGASEANNFILKSLRSKGHLIISPFEHASINAPIHRLIQQGFTLDIAPIKKNGEIDCQKLQKTIKKETRLISIVHQDSELGIIQNINEIAKICKKINPNIIVHSDVSQSLFKYPFEFENLDLLSFSGHKFGSIKGIGGIINLSSIPLLPLIEGGKSLSPLRAGTIPIELIVNCTVSMQKSIQNQDFIKVQNYKNKITNALKPYPSVKVNSPSSSSPYVLNLSFLKYPNLFIQRILSQNHIYISTGSTCANNSLSPSVLSLYQNKRRAQTAIRISLSERHQEREIEYLIRHLRRFT